MTTSTTDAMSELLRLVEREHNRIDDLETRVRRLEDVLATEQQMRRTLANRIDEMELAQ